MWDQSRFLYNVATAMSNERLQLIIYPTELCNFRCLYCYENHMGARMDNQTVERIKLFLKERIPSLKVLEIEWFGGEPLLAKDIVISVSTYAKTICEQFGVRFYAYLTSNGFLLDQNTFNELCRDNVLTYQITFDGDKPNHNKFRLPATHLPEGTFDRIWNNVLLTKELAWEFTIVLRCHITAINKDSIISLLKRIEVAFGNDRRYYVHLKEVSALGGKHDCELALLSKDSVKDTIGELKKEFPNLQYIDTEEEYVCYAAKPNSFAIRSDGSIIKCTVAMEDSVNHVGKIAPDGSLDLDQQKFLAWSDGLTSLNKDYLGCPYYRHLKAKPLDE